VHGFFARPGFTQDLTAWRTRQVPEDVMFDLHDADRWNEPQWENYRAESPCNLLLQLNLDWFQPYTYSTYSVCCVYLCILNLHRSVRYKRENVILLTLLPPGTNKTQEKVKTSVLNEMLRPAVDELLVLWMDGIMVRPDPAGNELVSCRAALFLVSCDMPACRSLGGFLAPTSRCGCWLCKKVTEQRAGQDVACVRDWGGAVVGEPRTNQEQRALAQGYREQDSKRRKETYASEHSARWSVLHLLPYFCCIWSFVVDPMHNLFLGVTKHTIQLWIDTGVLNAKALTARMEGVHLPSDVGRIFRKWANPKGLGVLTAADMKNFLLLLSETLLEGLIPAAYMRTWRHLVAGVKAIVSSHVVLVDALAGAHQHFVDFYKGFARIHGTAACTPNMHMLLHLVPLVRLYGPCHAFWCFAFERYNKVLTEVHNNRQSIEISIMK
jgi:hypothetical protein